MLLFGSLWWNFDRLELTEFQINGPELTGKPTALCKSFLKILSAKTNVSLGLVHIRAMFTWVVADSESEMFPVADVLAYTYQRDIDES